MTVSNKTFHVTVPVAEQDIAADRLWQMGVEAVGLSDEVDGLIELWTSVGSTGAAIERAVAMLEPHWTWWAADVVAPDETWRDHVAPTWYRTDWCRGAGVEAWRCRCGSGSTRHVDRAGKFVRARRPSDDEAHVAAVVGASRCC